MNYDFACLQVSQIAQYIAFFPSRETHETRTNIFTRSNSHFPQNSREKNCETRLAVNPTHKSQYRFGITKDDFSGHFHKN
jgi:hypothetical protein